MPGRIKRAAAASAESKIKLLREESSAEEDRKRRPRRSAAREKNHASSTVFDFDDAAPSPHKMAKLRATQKTKETQGAFRNGGIDDEWKKKPDNCSHAKQSSSFDRLADLLDSSDGSLSSFLSSAGPTYGRRTIVVEFSPIEKARMERQRRRSRRSINSTGPMQLSYGTSYRISMGTPSPACSPILATKLRFTPVAHIPTTPVPANSKGSTRRFVVDLRSRIGSCG